MPVPRGTGDQQRFLSTGTSAESRTSLFKIKTQWEQKKGTRLDNVDLTANGVKINTKDRPIYDKLENCRELNCNSAILNQEGEATTWGSLEKQKVKTEQ